MAVNTYLTIVSFFIHTFRDVLNSIKGPAGRSIIVAIARQAASMTGEAPELICPPVRQPFYARPQRVRMNCLKEVQAAPAEADGRLIFTAVADP